MAQKLIVPSPLRPQTTMAIEKLNMAANEAQPSVNSMVLTKVASKSYLGLASVTSIGGNCHD